MKKSADFAKKIPMRGTSKMRFVLTPIDAVRSPAMTSYLKRHEGEAGLRLFPFLIAGNSLTSNGVDLSEDMRNHVFSIGRFALVECVAQDRLEVVVVNKDQHFDLTEYCDKNELDRKGV